ncbi:questin oxidase family protein [Streptomyces sp. SBT349]|uniref:questin oxidase family protein n=1 Tax=Streptomyces sp. SBT349 TaxID=1580539 RepID=UPI00066BE151|nr:questin oxidase family protein [Streptomyces sp. SBT349]
MDTDAAGTLDEALVRLHANGPEFKGWLTNHAPMAVEALVRHGEGARVHRWVDAYRHRLEDHPTSYGRVTDANWREALGDPRHLADWPAYFAERLEERPWPEVLSAWWPRLLPGITAGATHPVIRVGHAVRVLLAEGETAPRRAELAHALGYWAARHQVLPPGSAAAPALGGQDAGTSAGAALRAVPLVRDQSGGINHRLAQLRDLPPWAAGAPADPEAARDRLRALVRAAAAYYATHAHGEPVMLVHAVTAPNAVLRTLPALPRALWRESLDAAWAASAGVVAAYGPRGGPRPPADAGGIAPDELFARAAAHGDEHVIKLTDTVLDLTTSPADGSPDGDRDGEGEGLVVGAALRSIELTDPDD